MNARLWLCILSGVFVVHVAVICIVYHWRNIGKPAPVRSEPNFESKTITIVDSQGRKVRETSEYTVITKFAEAPSDRKAPPTTQDSARPQ